MAVKTITINGRAADDINGWAGAGRLKPLIGRTYPLADAAKAEKDLEDNTLNRAGTLHGKIVIKKDDEHRVEKTLADLSGLTVVKDCK